MRVRVFLLVSVLLLTPLWLSEQKLEVQYVAARSLIRGSWMWQSVKKGGKIESEEPKQFLLSSEGLQGQKDAAHPPQNTTFSSQYGSGGSPGQQDVWHSLPQGQKDAFEFLPNTTLSYQYLQENASVPELSQKADIDNLSNMTSSPRYPQEVTTTTTTSYPQKKVTLVLVASKSEHGAFPRLAGSLASLASFGKPGSIHELIVVVPDRDVSIFSDSLEHNGSMLWEAITRSDWMSTPGFLDCWQRKQSFPVRVLSDSQVCPTPLTKLSEYLPAGERSSAGGRGLGYRLQMLLKLGVAVHVQTPFYVTLDLDVYAKKTFGYEDLVTRDGKAKIQGEAMYGGRSNHRVSWWEGSDRILDAKGCMLRRFGWPTIGVTPAVLSTRVSLALMERLYLINGNNKSWDDLIFSWTPFLDWTEYTLHFTAACVMGLREEVFDSNYFSNTTKLYEYSGFNLDDLFVFDAQKARDEFGQGAVFALKQSLSGVAASQVNLALLPPTYCNCEGEGIDGTG